MKLSIVTVCLNSVATIERTIKSVADQNQPGLEYVIVDGGSTDGTLEIIGRYHETGIVSCYVSAVDEGIADAFNKGIALSSGNVIGLLNADDYYLPEVLEKVASFYSQTDGRSIIHGAMQVGSNQNTWCVQPRVAPQLWKYVDIPYNHPGMFVPRTVYQNIGTYNTSYRYAMDYDFILRAMLAGITFYDMHEKIVFFSLGGTSNVDPSFCHREVLESQLKNNLSVPVCLTTFGLKMFVRFLKRVGA